MTIDFRSDTVTVPTSTMLHEMYKAPLGDDVYGEDPSVNKLEAFVADMFGMEAAVFCPSGTMTNQIAIKCHTQPGDEVICDVNSHIYQYEGGGIAFNSGCSVRLLEGDLGRISAAQVEASVNADDLHKAVSRLVSLENTANRGGGSCYSFQDIVAIREVCRKYGLAYHLDGARLFNALVARNETPRQYGEVFDTISVCLSKGLGAPVGSLLIGKKELIRKARRIRKVFGGGMRQAGMLAAAGLYAIEHNVSRLAQDHVHAKMIQESLTGKAFIKEILPVETNIIIFILHHTHKPSWFISEMKEKGIRVSAIGSDRIRMVTHLDITHEMVSKTIQVIESISE